MKPQVKTIAAALALAFATGSANAVLERTGPLNEWGFPTWYQDGTGIALEYCNPLNQAELDGGYCLLLPGDVTLPEPSVGAGYFDEHFWWAGEALMQTAQGSRALLVLAAEAAFAADPAPGGQVAFTRIRVRLDSVPVTGEYRFIHPYGEEVGFAEAGERIFITDDVGINCPAGQFDCAGQGRIGPFLLASDTPGGPELAAVTGPVPGKLYIAAPDRSGAVTGSPLPDFLGNDGLMHNHNVFRIEGPAGSNLGGPGIDYIETTDFSLMGRVFSGVMPGKISDLRANYADRDVSGKKVDVFLTAEPTGQSRVPAAERPAEVNPATSFFDRPCQTVNDAAGEPIGLTAPAGGVERLMKGTGENRWGQVRQADGVLPDAVCVKDNTGRDLAGNTVPNYKNVPVRDEVTISKAFYDPAGQTLTVEARSSDELTNPTLRLELFGTSRTLVDGQVTVFGVEAPPESVLVTSSKRGSAQLRVDTGYGDTFGGGSATATATNDQATIDEDGSASIAVLANDVDVTGAAVVSLVANPGFGTAVVNPMDNSITYTPQANVSGVDLFSYQVTVDGVASNIATVMVTVNAVNDAPVASNDLVTGAVGVPLVFNPLANDTDIDGPALSIVGLTGVAGPAGAVTNLVQNPDGSLSFTANQSGNYSFGYEASDGQYSSPATVTVSIAAPEAVAVTSGEFRGKQNRWRVGGTSSIEADHEVTVILTGNATCVEREVGRTTSVAGVFALDTTGPAPTTGCTQVRVESALGGISQPFTLRIRD